MLQTNDKTLHTNNLPATLFFNIFLDYSYVQFTIIFFANLTFYAVGYHS